jgi:hypothetical protein
MSQIVRMYPTSDNAASWSDLYGGATHTGAGAASGYTVGVPPDTTNIWEYCDDPYGSLDETNSALLMAKRLSTGTLAGYLDFKFGSAPNNVTVLQVDLYGYLRASRDSTPSANWASASPITVYGYVSATTGTGTACTLDVSAAATYTRRNNTAPTGTYALKHLGTWTTKPGGGAWVQADLVDLVGGIRILSMPDSNDQAADNRHVVEWASLWMDVLVDPTDSAVEGPRKILTHQLRLKSKPLKKVSVQLPPTFGYLEPGDTVWSAVPVDPIPGESDTSQIVDKSNETDERPLLVTSVEFVPSPPAVTIEAVDLRDNFCTYWGTWRSDIGLTSDYTGVALWDRGGGYSMVRPAAATGKDLMRRPNDFYFQEAVANKPRFGPFGLAVFGGQFNASSRQSGSTYTTNTGESTHCILNNTFSQGSGTTFTSWTSSASGTSYSILEGTTPLVDVSGYRRGVKLAMGNPVGTHNIYMYGDTPSLTNAYRLRFYAKFTAVSDTAAKTPNWLLRNTTTAADYNQGNDSWVGGGWNGFATANGSVLYKYQVGSGPVHYEVWSRQITIPSTSTYRIHFGYDSVANNTINYHSIGLVHQGTSTGAGQGVMRRDFNATQGSVVTPYADEYSIYNPSTGRIWEADRGFVYFRFIPCWDHEDLADAQEKYLVTAYHDDSNDDYEVILYHRVNSTEGYWGFERYRGGSLIGYAYQYTGGATLPNYMEPYAISARWTGTNGELGLAAYTMDVFVDGTKGSTLTPATYACRQESSGTTADIAPNIYIGHFPKTTTKAPYNFADGYFADFEVRNCCPTNQEVYLLHSRLDDDDLPTLVS